MSDPDEKKPPQSRMVQISTMVFLAAGIIGFEVAAPSLFPKPDGGGFNMERVMWAGIVGGICAGIGAGVGKLIDQLRK